MQLALMGAEALGLCAFVCVYMYILLNQVNNYRWEGCQTCEGPLASRAACLSVPATWQHKACNVPAKSMFAAMIWRSLSVVPCDLRYGFLS
jgi:hypothetical protein